MREGTGEIKQKVEIRTHPQSVLAGAIGAALWGAFRARKIAVKAVGGAR
jgi:activator of 2-hydroxyglutaryl-CoA dehydratase